LLIARVRSPIANRPSLTITTRPITATPPAGRTTWAAAPHALGHLAQFRFVQETIAVAVRLIETIAQHGRRFVLGQLLVIIRIRLFHASQECFRPKAASTFPRPRITRPSITGPR
jgi:hypothetical protein